MAAVLSAETTLESALPPFWQEVAELQALFQSPELKDHFDSADLIQEIQKSPNGYRIITQRRTVDVEVIFHPQSLPGPAKFSLQFLP